MEKLECEHVESCQFRPKVILEIGDNKVLKLCHGCYDRVIGQVARLLVSEISVNPLTVNLAKSLVRAGFEEQQ